MKTTLLITIMSAIISMSANAQGTWLQIANFGGSARVSAVSFTINGKGYIGTGDDGAYKNDFWEYDPTANVWTQKANFGGTARKDAVGFSIGTKGYIGTGDDGAYTNDFWEYDPAVNSWNQKANFSGAARSGAVGFSVGTKGYLGTGFNGAYTNDFYQYNPANNTWIQKTNFTGTPRQNAVGFSIGSLGYIGTGFDGAYKNDFYAYNPITDTWTNNWFSGTARSGAVGFSDGIKGYLALGYNGSYLKDFWVYDPAINNWAEDNNFLGTARTDAVGFAVSDFLYMGTGFDGTYKNDFYLFDSLSNQWKQKANFGGTVRSSAVGFSIGTKGYIGTGNNGLIDFWEWDQSTNSWSQKADFGGTGRDNAVGFSIGNKGYIGTGYNSNSAYPYVFKDFWEYDPTANTWAQKPAFGGTARRGAVGFSIGNKGYIGTGEDVNGSTSDFWEYDPAIGQWTQKAYFGGGARNEAIGFSIGNKGYIGTGGNPGGSDFWEYDPATDSWTSKAPFGGGVRQSAVGFSISTKGYIGTGYQSGTKNDFWEYDPISDTWTEKANFEGIARDKAVGFSIGTKGYIGTGQYYPFAGQNLSDIWEFDACGLIPVATVSKYDVSCYGNGNGSAWASVIFGTSPYTYLWSTNATTSSVTGLSVGNYSVTITDNNGCTQDSSVTITSDTIAQVPICLVTVDSTSTKNLIVWEKPVATSIDSFRIYREIGSNNYVRVGSVAYADLSKFTDTTQGINPNTTSYRYKISALDTCSSESTLSSEHKTIHLQISQAVPTGVNLNWTDYIGFSFNQYRILRDSNGTNNWQPIDSVSFASTTYTDPNQFANARYIVEVIHPSGCTATKSVENHNSSRSNKTLATNGITDINPDISVYIIPNPTTGKFTLQITNAEIQNAEVKIYNLLGEKIYQAKILTAKSEIDLSSHRAGIYFVEVKIKDETQFKKLIIE